jgi:hypothetical protein
MKSLITPLLFVVLLATPLAAQTMATLLPTLTYPAMIEPSGPTRTTSPEAGTTLPTGASSTMNCATAATMPVCVLETQVK